MSTGFEVTIKDADGKVIFQREAESYSITAEPIDTGYSESGVKMYDPPVWADLTVRYRLRDVNSAVKPDDA